MPSRMTRAVLQASLVVSSTLCAVVPARAGLGGSPMQLPAGATSTTMSPAIAHAAAIGSSGTQAATPASAAPPYSVIQTTLSSGTLVREYVSQSGTVFGIAWRGPNMPNLSQLLGDYFPQYASGAQAGRAAGVRGAAVVEQTGLVVHSGGHMGAFSGQAWLPQAMPAGVTGSDIQ